MLRCAGSRPTAKRPAGSALRTPLPAPLDGTFGSARIIIHPRLDLAKELTEELKNLQLEHDQETGNVRVTHREGQHDDLSICLAAANWWASKPKPNNTLRVIR